LKYAVTRFLLSAINLGGGLSTAGASTVNEIRKKEFKILVIDDDDEFRKSLCFKLNRKYKAQVEDVNSGELAIKKLTDGNSYDFIFTDIMMPGMTGIETYHEIQKIDAVMRIVIMSAYSDSEEWQKAQELKDVTLLHKPIPDDALIKILSEDSEG
jgi:CheY-like chemotaxis protein